MNTLTDWHYHLSGRNIKEDIIELKNYLLLMDEVYVMASYFPENGSGLSNYNLYYHLRDIEKTKLYLSLDFENYFFQGFNEMVSILEDNPAKIIGIKIYTGYQNIVFDEKFQMVIDLARKYYIYIMFHTGYLNGQKDKYNPMNLEKVFSTNKDIKFIIAHVGNPYIKETISLLNKYSNVYSDISGLIDSRIEIDETLFYLRNIKESVNNSKILFGTDFPLQTYEVTKIFANVFD